jgi:hypothetical protein
MLSASLMLVAMAGSAFAFTTECVSIKYRDTSVCLDALVCTEIRQSSFERE